MANFLKKIFKGVGKIFRKVVKSPLFKVVMLAAAIYTGGAAMGAWGGGGGAAAAGGAAAGGAAAGTAAGTSTAAAASAGAADAGLAGAATEAGTAAGAAGAAEGVAAASVPEISTAAGAAGGTAIPAATTAANTAATNGFLNNAIKGVGSYVEKNPMASAMMFNAASSALSPDEMDVMREQERIRRDRYKNMYVPGSVGASGTSQPLYYENGQPVYGPRGIINKGMTV